MIRLHSQLAGRSKEARGGKLNCQREKRREEESVGEVGGRGRARLGGGWPGGREVDPHPAKWSPS